MAKQGNSVQFDVMTGGSATTVACIFTNPMEVVKTRLQLQGELSKKGTPKAYTGLLDCAVKMARNEGILSLQKGLVPGAMYQFVMNGVRLGMYPSLKRTFGDDGTGSMANFLRTLAAASISGATGAAAGSPLFMIKCRIQAMSVVSNTGHERAKASLGHQHRYSGTMDGFTQVIKAEGIKGLWRGVDGAIPRVMVGSGSQLSTYDATKRLLLSRGIFIEGIGLHFASSMISGLVVTTIMNPFDVVSTRLYNQPQGTERMYKGPLDCFAKTWRAEGLGGFYKGWLAHYTRLGPHTVLTLVFWEQTKIIAWGMGFK